MHDLGDVLWLLVIGAIAGATVAHENDHGPNHPHHARHRGHVHAYTAPVRYESEGHGAVARCDPPRDGYYRPTVVRVEERPVKVRTVTTKTQMRKVCRYEPVRTTRVTEKRVTQRVVVASR